LLDRDPDAAIIEHTAALALADDLGQPLDRARAHDGLAYALRALGRGEDAHAHWQQALDILTEIGVDHTDEQEATVDVIRAQLTVAAEVDSDPAG
jgi:hypothetical protein